MSATRTAMDRVGSATPGAPAMIALHAPSVERAIAALSARSLHVVRASRLALTLVDANEVDASVAEAIVVLLDGASLAESVTRVATLPAGRTIAWVMPVARDGVVGWAVARARRLQPIALEDACDALRHAGVIDVHVTTVPGSLPIAVIRGKTTA